MSIEGDRIAHHLADNNTIGSGVHVAVSQLNIFEQRAPLLLRTLAFPGTLLSEDSRGICETQCDILLVHDPKAPSSGRQITVMNRW